MRQLLAPAFAALAAVLPAQADDTPLVPYEVVATLGEAMEVRRYGPRAAVETDAADGTSSAFRRLFGYIDGGNRPAETIAMTAPVETAPAGEGESIAMTAPVETTGEAEGRVMRFFLPEGMTAETAPEPTDPAVRRVTVPARTEAAYRFSGWVGVEGALGEAPKLRAALEGSGWTPSGPARAYLYDPPWTLPWNRRNEVVIPVEPAPSG
jgi:SOUL heme-binding protein.